MNDKRLPPNVHIQFKTTTVPEDPVRQRTFQKRQLWRANTITAPSLFDTIQFDLADFSNIHSRGYKYILVVVDVYSRFLLAANLKRKADAWVAMEGILETIKQIAPKARLRAGVSDNGGEFRAQQFQQVLKNHGIAHITSRPGDKFVTSIVESTIRTIRFAMRRRFLREQKHQWSEYLTDVVSKYNQQKHSSIRVKPVDVVFNNKKPRRRAKKRLRIILPGSHVRVLATSLTGSRGLHSDKFEKKSMRVNWSIQVYKVLSVLDGRLYTLENLKTGQRLKSKFREWELLVIPHASKTEGESVEPIEDVVERIKTIQRDRTAERRLAAEGIAPESKERKGKRRRKPTAKAAADPRLRRLVENSGLRRSARLRNRENA